MERKRSRKMKWHWKRARWLFCFLLSLACSSCFILFERILFLCRPFAQTSDRTNGRFVDTITWAASTHSPSQSFMSFIRHHAEHHTVSIWFAIIPKWAVVALPFSSGAFHCFSFFFFAQFSVTTFFVGTKTHVECGKCPRHDVNSS